MITEGFHVPVIPFLETAGNRGGVVPAQKGAIELKVGVNTGFDKIIPVKRFVSHPLAIKEKLE